MAAASITRVTITPQANVSHTHMHTTLRAANTQLSIHVMHPSRPAACAKTLAATVSADSIVALTSVLLLAHLFLHDYRCARFCVHFAQVLLSLELYLLSPYVRRYIHAGRCRAQVSFSDNEWELAAAGRRRVRCFIALVAERDS
eukprot:scaffold45992_cov22-Tisochrysis_lutea.AAC.1